ncbi:MAG: AgmX/PglI C-terminal domain-containing protein [Alteromonadaceae bacterium]|nr:AgmX/PglI C-terminal domain-containing protein [Alteromonadaceae bacterium]MBL4911048.1 AgmX/PglI C-terminal domain-containing protein [Alteromonadaceae bacterium]
MTATHTFNHTTVHIDDHKSKNNELQGFNDLLKPSAQDKNFNKILTILLLMYLLFAVGIPLIEQVKVSREIKERPPAQLAKIMLKEKQLPLPKKPPLKPKKKPLKKAKVKAQEKAKQKAPTPVSKNDRALAKTKAHSSGLATMKDELFAMREAFVVMPATTTKLNNSKTKATTIKRKLLAAATNKQSSQLTQAQLGKTVTSDALSTKNTEHIRLGKEEILANNNALTVSDNGSTTQLGHRSEMTLRRTLEAHKARLYTLYNRALRKDPLLKGKVLFAIEIQPNGSISHVTIKSSALHNAKLERQLIVILRRIKFPAEDVAVMTTIWAIDFLPS